MSKNYEDRPIEYVKIDCDSEGAHKAAKEYKISAIPSYRVFKDGEVSDLTINADTSKLEESLETLSEKALKL